MALRIILYSFVKGSPFLRLLLVLMLETFYVTECAKQLFYSRDVGGNVTFCCTEDRQRPIKYMYLQRGTEFVNGFYSSRTIEMKPWENTKLDQEGAAVDMFNLNVSHDGNYNCYFELKGSDETVNVSISLRLKAPYSKPSISADCNEEGSRCVVKCQSHSGYPRATLEWNIRRDGSNSSQVLKSVNSSEVCSQTTQLFNTSIADVFNCSAGELRISCSVNGSVSDVLAICDVKDPPDHYAAIAGGCVLVSILMAILLFLCWKKKRPSRRRAESSNENNLSKEEVVALRAV